MSTWIRYARRDGSAGFGTVSEDGLHVEEFGGSMFGHPESLNRRLELASVVFEAPCEPGKVIALWNNFYALSKKLDKAPPKHPLFLIKPAASVIGTLGAIRRPVSYGGKIAYEGELGIVIGQRCSAVSVEEAEEAIFGYTCVNDVTAAELLQEDPNFPQWCRAKGFDTFCCLGPSIVTGFDWRSARVVTTLDNVERQNYPIDDMIFTPAEQVSMISHDLTLEPGDVIACGTSIGIGSMADGATVCVSIAGIGALTNTVAGHV